MYGATTDGSLGMFGGIGSGWFWKRQIAQVSTHEWGHVSVPGI